MNEKQIAKIPNRFKLSAWIYGNTIKRIKEYLNNTVKIIPILNANVVKVNLLIDFLEIISVFDPILRRTCTSYMLYKSSNSIINIA